MNFEESWQFYLFSASYSRHFLLVSIQSDMVRYRIEDSSYYVEDYLISDIPPANLAILFKLGMQLKVNKDEKEEQDNMKTVTTLYYQYELGDLTIRTGWRGEYNNTYTYVRRNRIWQDISSTWLNFSKLE